MTLLDCFMWAGSILAIGIWIGRQQANKEWTQNAAEDGVIWRRGAMWKVMTEDRWSEAGIARAKADRWDRLMVRMAEIVPGKIKNLQGR